MAVGISEVDKAPEDATTRGGEGRAKNVQK